VSIELQERLGGLKRRLDELENSGLWHHNSAVLVDLDALERGVEIIERVARGEKLSIRLGSAPPVAVPGRKRGFKLSEDGGADGDE
jgi:hypothetical protein